MTSKISLVTTHDYHIALFPANLFIIRGGMLKPRLLHVVETTCVRICGMDFSTRRRWARKAVPPGRCPVIVGHVFSQVVKVSVD